MSRRVMRFVNPVIGDFKEPGTVCGARLSVSTFSFGRNPFAPLLPDLGPYEVMSPLQVPS